MFLACLVMACGLQGARADSLVASVDRTELPANESLQLSLSASIEVSFGFNLFDLRLPSPDFAPLQEDFEILDQRQRYNFQSINGQNQANVTWTLTLLPKRSGTLTIPPLQFRNAQSESIQIQVSEQAPGSIQRESVFLEVQVSKDRVFVQEQLIYTLRLYYQQDILGGELSAPELADAVVRQIDKQREYSRTIDGRSYQVIERRYLIIPQKSGTLEIKPQEFSGTFYDSRIRNRRHVRTQSEAISLTVTPPPAQAGSQVWLPAMSLVVIEDWSRNPDELKVGDSVTRTLTIKALGLEGSQLPPLPRHEIAQLKQYPEQPQINTETHADGVTGTRIERTAIVAVHGGEVLLPEIRLPWYDTANDEWRTAVVPARTIRITGAPATSDTPVAQTQPAQTRPDASVATDGNAPSQTLSNQTENALPWPWISLALLILWLATLILLLVWRRGSSAQSEQSQSGLLPQSARDQEQQAFAQLKSLAGQDWRKVRPALLHWSRAFWPAHSIQSLTDLMDLARAPALSDAIRNLEASCYSSNASGSRDVNSLIQEVERIRQGKQQTKEKRQELAELYPVSGL